LIQDEQYQQGMKNYNALISHVDDAAGEIVEELKRQGLYDSTMIIFTCDNGMMLGNHAMAGKWHPFEESIRVPLIIHDPRLPKEARGALNDHFTLNVDLATTILGAAGLEPSTNMQGRDIADLYLPRASAAPWREDFFYEFPLQDIAASTALVTKQFKYMKFERNGIEMLFDLENDPYELNDLMESEHVHADLLPKLKERYQQLKEEATNNTGLEIAQCVRGINP
jgi:arylsulfatase